MAPSQAALTRLAILANMATAALLGAGFAFSHRLFATADEMAHLDHAYAIWKGRLPVFEDGIVIHPGFGFMAPDQWTSQHPPLFYALAAPVVGPLIDAGHYVAAGYAGRALSAILACFVVAGVMWAAREIAPERRAFWLASGAVAAVHPPLTFLAGVFYNDNALIALAAGQLAVTVRILRRGPTWPTLALFALFSAAELLTRSSAIAVIGVCGLVLLVTFLRQRAWRWVAALAGAGIVAALASGWFYLRNRRLTGSLLGGQPADSVPYMRHRIARPLPEVLVDGQVWKEWHLVWGFDVVSSTLVALLLVGLPVAVAAALAVRRLLRHRRPGDVAVVLLLAGLVVLVVLMQAQYVAQRGGASWRYLMPLLPVTSLAAAWVVTAWRRLTPVLLPAWVLLAVVPLAVACGRSLGTPEPTSTAPVFPAATWAALALGAATLTAAVAVILRFAADERPHYD